MGARDPRPRTRAPRHTEELLRVAAETGNREMAFLAHNAGFHAFLERCDGEGIDIEVEAMAAIAGGAPQPFYRWHVVCLRAVRAMLDARFADAERLAAEALRIARLRQSGYAGYVFEYAQMLAIRWLRGRLGELRDALAPHGESFPWIPRWRDALLAAELEDEEAAAAEIEGHAAHGFAALPHDGLWIVHLCALAECCVLLHDARRAGELYELLAPYADRNAVTYTLQPLGPVALRLGMLAGVLGRWDAVEGHFDTALACCERLGARAFRPRVLLEHARTLARRDEPGERGRARDLLAQAGELGEQLGTPGLVERAARLASELERSADAAPRPAAEILFRREGELWTIGYAGRVFHLRDAKGLRYIELLSSAPGRDLHALELAQAVAPGPPAPARPAGEPGLEASWPTDAGAALDREAKEAYRQRLAELEDDLDQARAWGDIERAARLQEEGDFVTRELAAALGLGGRDRPTASPEERARISVTTAIKAAIRAIDRESPALATHLSESIQTGRLCRYAPPRQAPPHWAR